MYKPSDVDDYINHHETWKDELSRLRSVLVDSELDETIKWYIPTYTLNGKNVLGIGAFKGWVALWFFHGSFLSDPYQILVNAQESKTKGLRQWRFSKHDEMDLQKIALYIAEATENQRKGLVTKIEKKVEVALEPESLLKTAIIKSKEATFQWEKYNQKKRNDFIRFISEAKRESTKISRIEKIIPLIEYGRPVADLYK